MQISGYQVFSLLEGTFLLDGGSMFGIVPRPLWARHHPPDERGRIVMALRCLLLVGEGRRILVDAGLGERFRGKSEEIYRYRANGGGLSAQLARLGVRPDDITDVIASHLHFDHVGGLLSAGAAGALTPVFPRARVHLQREGWEWARAPSLWDEASFFQQDLDVWERTLELDFLSGDAELAPRLRVRANAGHTPGHQVVIVGEGSETLVFCADLIPTATHLRLPYIMAYDQRPLQTLEEKEILLAQALEEDWILVFEHDPFVAACRLQEKDGRAEAAEAVCLNLPAPR
ncbi:MAG: MBL fold metallo-hydrolase [Myxococcales bacterium]|nr:MBL fold metallo-hydrolase [Myxococcales bacterium]